MREDWRDRAACRGKPTEWWFPSDDGEGPGYLTGLIRRGKQVCARCDVRDACLAYALANHERHGVWGGLTPTERRHEAWRTG